MRSRTVIVILLLLIGALSALNFASERAQACYTQRTTVNPGGDQTIDDGHIYAEQDITELGGSVTYTIVISYSPGCGREYDFTFHKGNAASGWSIALKDSQGADLDGVMKRFSMSGSFTMYYTVTAVSAPNGAVLESVPWVFSEDYINEQNTVHIHTKTTVNIPNTAPDIQLLTPNGGERWRGISNVTWTATDEEDDDGTLDVTLRYSINSGRDWTLIERNLPNTGKYIWDTRYVPDGTNYKVQLVVRDRFNAAGFDESDSPFVVDNVNPVSVVVSSPSAGVTWFSTKTIAWSAIDSKEGDCNLEVTLQYGNGRDPNWENIATEEENDGVYEWDTSEVEDGDDYRIRVYAVNCWDWRAQDITDEFIINNNDYLDTDGDGYADCDDAFPTDPDEWLDSDGDLIGNNADPDDDNDGYTDEEELNRDSNPLDPDSMPDFDGDGIDDRNDPDNDNDGFDDLVEKELGRDHLDGDDFPQSMINLVLDCPCDMLITDSRENRLGYVGGYFYDEIAGGILVSDEDLVETYAIYDPDDLKYTVIGMGDGQYDLMIEYICGDDTKLVEARTISISLGERNRYTVDWDKVGEDEGDAITLEIDSDGDSYYDLTIEMDSPITMDDLRDTDGDGKIDRLDADDDNDGYSDRVEVAEDSDPLADTSIPDDLDGDLIPDTTDEDMDGDGVYNDFDAYPEDEMRWEVEDTLPDTPKGGTTDSESKSQEGAVGMGHVGSMDTAYLILIIIVGIIFLINAGLIFVVKKKLGGRPEDGTEVEPYDGRVVPE